ncbi:unnamed protein product [Tilletia controversa]|uniref:RlpA-like protein double-psi beta-barrel domain-containing protein n=3 Tax=Tilletia TaxID=13289 RepID=A0A8X7MXJ5_9BASI|nr:hypothetical protein CF336_g8108 [Tilletia laevis]KAE8184598.1 hypothetical protein CF328_g7810 [Tilletia controversa]KAE8243987.1 hypothetical protein A4X03_0g7642 [Tilletia caries]KAE8207877.1 hypothetical protein CF335_g825 [Tilletia laevis]KAE8251795.1 hypothetical protein A4X06_0g2526 [Tilletia controversa]
MFARSISILSLATLAMALPLSKRGYSGTATFYDAGLGNCGTTVSPNAMVVALNTAQYGSTSTVSSHCFKTVTITNLKNGKTMNAIVQDSCPTCSFGDLDMSTSLFSALNNGNMDDGIFPISWSFGGQGGSDDWSPPKSSTKAYTAPAYTPPAYTPKPSKTSNPAPSTTSSPARVAASTTSAVPTPIAPPSFLAPTNTTLINGTIATTPAWWDELDMSCWKENITLPTNVTGVVIGPSKFANTTTELSAQCGKWINATNTDNGKSILALIVSYVPGGTRDQIALANGYTALADLSEGMPSAIANVEWGIIAGNSTTNATATTTATN